MLDRYYETIVRLNDDQVAYALDHQVHDNSRHAGGIRSEHTGIPNPSHGGTAMYIACFTAALLTTDSRYYQDTRVLQALDDAVDYMLHRQHADGTISLGGTNFNSPPDTGFVATGLAQVYQLLSANEWGLLQPIAAKVKLFLENTIPAFLTGGCHTPNHRWVITAALGSLYHIFKDERLVERAEQWLAEGMDCTADGEWTERSNGIYNTVSNVMLFYTAHYLARPELLEYVRRNLRMMVYMTHDDGEVVTDYSGRQDFGVKHDLSGYFLSYLLMADYDKDPLFAAMFDQAAATISHVGSVNNHALLGYMMFPTRLQDVPRERLPDEYYKVFNEHHPLDEHLRKMQQVGHHGLIEHSSMHTSFGAPVIRYRNKKTSATMMTRAPSFFSLRHGDARLLGMSLATMFTPGIVEMEKLQLSEAGIHMSSLMEKGYRGPVPQEQLPPSLQTEMSPWYLLPHHLRPETHIQQHTITVDITEHERQWAIRIASDEREDVITQLTLLFAAHCTLTGEGLLSDGLSHHWQEGALRCSGGDDWLEISSGRYDHAAQIVRGGIEQASVHQVRVNLLTPFDHTFHIRLSN